MVDLYQYVYFEMALLNGNDLATYGLWTYDIPTLIQSSVTERSVLPAPNRASCAP